MKKILAGLLSISFLFAMIVPMADAAGRIRRSRESSNIVYVPQYISPVSQTNWYNNPQIYATSAGSTYYYSPTYVAGYTYYTSPTPGYYYYSSLPSSNIVSNTTRQGQYLYSQNYIAGYTYYTSPNAGYYYYYNTTTSNNPTVGINTSYIPTNSSNLICTVINNTYQCIENSYGPTSSTYPGCSSADIVIGGQIWASCNALDRNAGSMNKSGWFFAGDSQSTFISYNGSNTTLEWMGKQTQTSAWTTGPCASGYRLPNRGEWEVLQSYARANSSTLASLISLQSNWAYQASRNSAGDVTISSRLSVSAGYWTSTMDGVTPTVMHIGSRYAGYNTTGTDYGYVNTSSQWSYTDTGLELMQSTVGELANARCVRQ